MVLREKTTIQSGTHKTGFIPICFNSVYNGMVESSFNAKPGFFFFLGK